MFVNIVRFPPVKADKDEQFRGWFAWSNEEYAKYPGLISRELLRPREGGNYVAIAQHESYETFMAMNTSPTHAEISKAVSSLLDGDPVLEFYEAVVEPAPHFVWP